MSTIDYVWTHIGDGKRDKQTLDQLFLQHRFIFQVFLEEVEERERDHSQQHETWNPDDNPHTSEKEVTQREFRARLTRAKFWHYNLTPNSVSHFQGCSLNVAWERVTAKTDRVIYGWDTAGDGEDGLEEPEKVKVRCWKDWCAGGHGGNSRPSVRRKVYAREAQLVLRSGCCGRDSEFPKPVNYRWRRFLGTKSSAATITNWKFIQSTVPWVFIKVLTGKVFTFEAESSDTMYNVGSKIEDKRGYHTNNEQIVFSVTVLIDFTFGTHKKMLRVLSSYASLWLARQLPVTKVIDKVFDIYRVLFFRYNHLMWPLYSLTQK